MNNNVSIFLLVKQTWAFIWNAKRYAYLITVPFAACFAVAVMQVYYPLFTLAETVELRLQVNFYTLFFSLAILSFCSLALMQHVQQVVFFGEPDDKKRFFLPVLNRAFFSYLFDAVVICCNALFFSVLAVSLLASVFYYFQSLPKHTGMYMAMGTLFFIPYFLIRFHLKLPARIAGKKIKFWTSWKMTARITPRITAVVGLFLIVPAVVVSLLCSLAGILPLSENVLAFIAASGSLWAFLTSVILSAAFSGYLYSQLTPDG